MNAFPKLKVIPLSLDGLLLLEPTVFGDDRGFFFESYNRLDFEAAGIRVEFVQDSHSRSAPGILRGLHYQSRKPQGQLVRVAAGRIWDVVVDLRLDSPTFGRWQGLELDSTQRKMLWMPRGFAHGFCVLGDAPAEVLYKADEFYDAGGELGVAWNDPELGISWPATNPVLSQKDLKNPSLKEWKARMSAGAQAL